MPIELIVGIVGFLGIIAVYYWAYKRRHITQAELFLYELKQFNKNLKKKGLKAIEEELK